jgi:hypothetical protein
MVAAIGLIASIAIGCGLAPQHRLDLVFPADGPEQALPVTILDPGGLVRAVAVGAPADIGGFGGEVGVTPLPGSSTSAVVSWIGGACDTRTTMSLSLRGSTIVIALATETRGGACSLVGLIRKVTIDFAEQIGARTFELVPNG